MRIELFTEGSATTRDPQGVDTFANLFEGGFLSVQSLAEDLTDYGEMNLHILSDKYGYVTGSDVPSEDSEDVSETDYAEFGDALASAAESADAILVLLTVNTFNRVVEGQWEDLVRRSNEEQIWCFGASRGALSRIDISALQEHAEVIVYERVGVARIGNETREELLESIASRANTIDAN